MISPRIIFEDDNFFVIDKPSGWVTNEANTVTLQPVLQRWVRENFDYPLKNNSELRNGIVHRLDKETSGIVIVAKTSAAFVKLQDEFKSREVKKTYVALLHGNLQPSEGLIRAEVGRLPWRRDRFGIISGGRESETEYRVIEFYPEERGGYTLTNFFPKTGRTHQIRIHAKHVGHAIVSDEFYAGRKTARNDRKFCPRLFLHASGIKFIHPVTLKVVEFSSPLPDELDQVLELIKKKTKVKQDG